jgi:hypothetical protein
MTAVSRDAFSATGGAQQLQAAQITSSPRTRIAFAACTQAIVRILWLFVPLHPIVMHEL